MNLHELIDQVEAKTGADRREILDRARAAWPRMVAFKQIQVALMIQAFERAGNELGVKIRQDNVVEMSWDEARKRTRLGG